MITGATRYAAVVGWPIAHTRSPAMHNAAFSSHNLDTIMIPLSVQPKDLATVVQSLACTGCIGASITAPHKLPVVALCSDVSSAARSIGAVNCLQFIDGNVIGHNTDSDGFADNLRESGITLAGKSAVLLGAGGAARAVAYGLRECASVTVLARRAHEINWIPALEWTSANLERSFASADFIVDCTTTALAGDEEGFVAGLPWSVIASSATVISLAYHREPLLLMTARQRQLAVVDGSGMLLHQGARAYALWTGRAAPLDEMRAALLNSP
jgi:shikimate dehydrogenase